MYPVRLFNMKESRVIHIILLCGSNNSNIEIKKRYYICVKDNEDNAIDISEPGK